jgi:molybdopterin/thiamine biosynthesis adenylyltransferase
MARCALNGVGQLHIHAHGGRDTPVPSITDSTESPPLARSLWNVDRTHACGWGILNNDSGWASIFVSIEEEAATEPEVAIIGYPVTISPARRIAVQAPWWWRKLFRRKRTTAKRYDRQSFLGTNSDKILANLRVAIIGLGGGGSHIAQQLAHLGVSHFVLCDPDRISETNLNRTVGATVADVAQRRLKTEIAKRQIRSLHSDLDVLTIGRWENTSRALLHCDVVIGCVDTFTGRRDLEAFCRRHLIPYLDVGMDVQKVADGHYEIIGQLIMSMPGRPCMRCMNFLTEELLAEEARRYGDAGGRPQVVWPNGVICSAAVGVVVDLVTGWSRNRRESVYLNFRGTDLSLRDDPRLKHLPPNCEHYPLVEAGDPVWKLL